MYDDSSGGSSALYFILWLAVHGYCGVRTYNIAEQKGHNSVLAGILGFIFGIWALLIYRYAVQPSANAGVWNEDTGSSPAGMAPPPQISKKCWSCGNPVAGNLAQCPTCGSRLNF